MNILTGAACVILLLTASLTAGATTIQDQGYYQTIAWADGNVSRYTTPIRLVYSCGAIHGILHFAVTLFHPMANGQNTIEWDGNCNSLPHETNSFYADKIGGKVTLSYTDNPSAPDPHPHTSFMLNVVNGNISYTLVPITALDIERHTCSAEVHNATTTLHRDSQDPVVIADEISSNSRITVRPSTKDDKGGYLESGPNKLAYVIDAPYKDGTYTLPQGATEANVTFKPSNHQPAGRYSGTAEVTITCE